MLAYLFWHRPRAGVSRAGYEEAQLAFHHSLARNPPAGLLANVSLRVAACPWLEGGPGSGGEAAYEDWYVIADWTAVGVLEHAAVGAGHRSRHDRAAELAGAGTGSLYRLLDGGLEALGAPAATWVGVPPGTGPSPVGELLLDGVERDLGALWRRSLALGPSPEYCLLAPEAPAGVAPSRLPRGWTARTLPREPLLAP